MDQTLRDILAKMGIYGKNPENANNTEHQKNGGKKGIQKTEKIKIRKCLVINTKEKTIHTRWKIIK